MVMSSRPTDACQAISCFLRRKVSNPNELPRSYTMEKLTLRSCMSNAPPKNQLTLPVRMWERKCSDHKRGPVTRLLRPDNKQIHHAMPCHIETDHTTQFQNLAERQAKFSSPKQAGHHSYMEYHGDLVLFFSLSNSSTKITSTRQ